MSSQDWGYLPSTSHMLDVICSKLGIEEGKRRIESVRKADQVRMAVAIAIVYKSIGE